MSPVVQDQAERFYVEKLGLEKRTEFPAGDARWLTVVAPGRWSSTCIPVETILIMMFCSAVWCR